MTVPRYRLPHLARLLAACAIVALSGCSQTPADDSAEAGFARDMATHHAQAVEMAFIIRDVTSDDALRALSEDIIVTQSAQRGMFMAWLQQWRLPQAAESPRMTWMGSDGASHATAAMQHATDGHEVAAMPPMAGMATAGEMDRLRSATGREAEVLFLQMMIRHHEGGVLMARALLERSALEYVVTLARGIDSGQRGEITSMTQMLRARDAQPLPSLMLPRPGQ